jgi:hypothetical protein
MRCWGWESRPNSVVTLKALALVILIIILYLFLFIYYIILRFIINQMTDIDIDTDDTH